MVKINHNRPHLRYIDNLQRELARQARRDAPAWYDQPSLNTLGRKGPFAAGIVAFDGLTAVQQEAVNSLFDRYGKYMETLSAFLATFSDKSRKASGKEAQAAKEDAYAALVAAGAVFMHQAAIDEVAGCSGLREWYKGLIQAAPQDDRHVWSELTEILTTESMPLLEAALEAKLI